MILAVQQAKYAWEHRAAFDKPTRIAKVVELGEWGVFSNRQIGIFTGMRIGDVSAHTGKTDTTGGTLKPMALGPILEVMHVKARGETDFYAVKRALDAGTSTIMLSRLTGIPVSTVSRQARRAAGFE